MVELKAKARLSAIGLLCASLVLAQQANAFAAPDIGAQATCTYTQVAASPGATEFINNTDLQPLLSAAAGDVSCTAVEVDFTSGFVFLDDQELEWAGTQPLTFAGVSQAGTTLDADDGSRALHVTAAAAVTIQDLTITKGLADGAGGGGILSNGSLNIVDSAITHSQSPTSGGGISVGGDLLMSDGSLIDSNVAQTSGGGIDAQGDGIIDSSVISNNTVAASSGAMSGGGISFTDGNFDIANSLIESNSIENPGPADSRGGGIAGHGDLALASSKVTSNSAESGGESLGGGAAVENAAITDSQISGNSAVGTGIVSGAGVIVGNAIDLVRSTVSGNSGLSSGDDVRGTIWVWGPLSATNSTISDNSGEGSGNVSPGIYGVSGTITAIFSTLVENDVVSGNAQGREITGGSQVLVAQGSVIANPNGDSCESVSSSSNSKFNIQRDADSSCPLGDSDDGTRSVTWEGMDLEALADNGGPTETRAIGASSQLNGVIPNGAGTDILGATPTDQRGVIRTDTFNTTPFSIGAEQNAMVNFDPNFLTGGTMSPQQAINTTPLDANVYVRSGYEFVGWRTTPTGGTFYANQAPFPFATRAPGQANITLFAQWGNAVTYDGNANTGGSPPIDTNSPYVTGGTVTVLGKGSLVKSGEVFVGWNTQSDGSGTSYLPAATFAMPSTPVTLYAQWGNAVTYDGNANTGGSPPTDPDSPHVTGDTVTVLGKGSLVKSGAVFVGWNTLSDGSGTAYQPTATFTMPSVAVTLFAQWSSNPPSTHSVTYFGNGSTSGSAPVDPSSPYARGSIVTVLGKGTLTKSGAAFVGWNTKANGSGATLRPGRTFRMPSTSVRLFARWKANTPPQPQTVACLAHRIHMSSDGTIPLTGPDCLSSDDVPVGTAFGFINRGDYRQPRLMCQKNRQLWAPKRLPSRYGQNSFFCTQGVLVLATHRRPGWYVVTWRAPATANALPFVKTVRFRI